jgi:hypothetical protein
MVRGFGDTVNSIRGRQKSIKNEALAFATFLWARKEKLRLPKEECPVDIMTEVPAIAESQFYIKTAPVRRLAPAPDKKK